VTTALLDAAIDVAWRAGAPALEAYPIDTDVPGHTTNLFPGIASVFAGRGFELWRGAETSSPIFFSTLGLHFVSAYDTGHMSPSSRFAASWKPKVE
jgi:hypothetical protein